MQIAVPLYAYPSLPPFSGWIANAKIGIVNPASGPGTSADPAYVTAIANARAAGVKLLGYVDTSYGAVPLSTVQSNIGLWKSLYGQLDGIFFDQSSPDCANLNYYRQCVQAAQAQGFTFNALNAGGTMDQCYDTIGASALMTFENTYSAWQTYTPPAWEASATAQIWTIVHTTPCGSVANAVTLASSRTTDLLYVTGDTMPNPFDALVCWNEFVAAMGTAGGGGGNTGGADTASTSRFRVETKRTSPDLVGPGSTVTWTVKVTNTSTTVGGGRQLTVPVPTGLSGRTWTATGDTGTSSGATSAVALASGTLITSGTGAINLWVGVPEGKSVTFTITDTLDAPSGTTVKVTADYQDGGSSSATITSKASPVLKLTKTRTSGSPTVRAGTVTWTVALSNSGTADGTTTVNDPVPTGISARQWTASGGTGATSGTGPINETVTVAPGVTRTYTVTDTVATTATNGQVITNTVTAGSLTSTGTVTVNVPAVTVTQTRSVSQVAPGGTVRWRITATNTGTTTATTTLTAPLPPTGVNARAWSVQAATLGGTGSLGTSGTGPLTQTLTLPAGATVTWEAVDTVTPGTPAGTVITNTVSVEGTTQALSATVVTPLITVDKARTTTGPVAPNGQIPWTAHVRNTSGFGTTVHITDPVPTGIASRTWTTERTPGITGVPASGTGPITLDAYIPAGGTITFTGTDTAAANATVGSTVVNRITAGDVSASWTADIKTASYTLTKKRVSSALVAPGSTVTWDVTVKNISTVTGTYVLTDPLPPSITERSWTVLTATYGTTGITGTGQSGTGPISQTVTIPPGGYVTWRVIDTVTLTATAGLVITNAAAVGEITTTDTTTVGAPIELAITKTARTNPGDVKVGSPVRWHVTFANKTNATGVATLTDPATPGTTARTWTVTRIAGTVTGHILTGSGDINQTVTLSPHAEIDFEIVETVTALNGHGTVTNTAATGTVTATATAGTPQTTETFRFVNRCGRPLGIRVTANHNTDTEPFVLRYAIDGHNTTIRSLTHTIDHLITLPPDTTLTIPDHTPTGTATATIMTVTHA